MSSPRAFWPGFIAAGVTYQVLALRRGDGSHLCACIRDTFHTNTKPGALAFVATCVGGIGLLIPHVLNGAANAIDELVTAIEEATP